MNKARVAQSHERSGRLTIEIDGGCHLFRGGSWIRLQKISRLLAGKGGGKERTNKRFADRVKGVRRAGGLKS